MGNKNNKRKARTTKKRAPEPEAEGPEPATKTQKTTKATTKTTGNTDDELTKIRAELAKAQAERDSLKASKSGPSYSSKKNINPKTDAMAKEIHRIVRSKLWRKWKFCTPEYEDSYLNEVRDELNKSWANGLAGGSLADLKQNDPKYEEKLAAINQWKQEYGDYCIHDLNDCRCYVQTQLQTAANSWIDGKLGLVKGEEDEDEDEEVGDLAEGFKIKKPGNSGTDTKFDPDNCPYLPSDADMMR